MHDDSPTIQTPCAVAASHGATVTDLASRRRSGDVLRTITFVFGGVHYGTLEVSARFSRVKPMMLYLVDDGDANDGIAPRPVDCLVTDDVTLSADLHASR